MNIVSQCALVGLGGFIGSILRYLVVVSISGISIFGTHGLAAANLTGCFLAGLLMPMIAGIHHWKLLVGIGFLGSFTTMSAFSSEVLMHLKEERVLEGTIFLLSHISGCILICSLGLALGLRLKV